LPNVLNKTSPIVNAKNVINNTSLFDGKIFQFNYFLKNGIREDLDLSNPNDLNGKRPRVNPRVQFTFNKTSNILNASIDGYCNATNAKYRVDTDYLEVLQRESTTLNDCGGNEETNYFLPITGNIYMQQPAKNVNYHFNIDTKELFLWVDENNKLVFTERVLGLEENSLEEAISIYPNPSKGIINIDIKSNFVEILEVSIIDFQGKELLKSTSNHKTIDISKLLDGIYFIKLKSKSNSDITRIIIKN